MKKVWFISLGYLAIATASAQPATQDANGKGTILTRASYIGLDLSKPEVTFAVNNLRKPQISKNNHPVWGGFLQAKNNEGLANVFTEGVPAASGLLRGYAGYRWSNALPPANTRAAFLTDFRTINDQIIKLDEDLKVALKAELLTFLPTVSDEPARKQIKDDLENFVNGNSATLTVLNRLNPTGADSQAVRDAKAELTKRLKPVVDQYKKKLASLNQQQTQVVAINNATYWSTIVYLFGGVRGTSFKAVNAINQTSLSASFKDTLFRGDEVGVGLNARYGFLEGGLTIAAVNTSNFNYLTKREYTLRTTQAQTNGAATLIGERKLTAYEGAFQRVKAVEVNADLIGYAPLSEREMMLINLYGRFTTYSDKEGIYPKRADVGLGLYFHQNDGKFLGGLYVELPDVSGQVTKLIDGVAPSRAIRRFQFGIVTRYNLTSLLNW